MTVSLRILLVLLLGCCIAFSQKAYHARKLTRGDHPVFSPDGKKIAAEGGRLTIVDRNGKILTQVKSLLRGAEPAWSPDGRKIAFASYAADSSPVKNFAIWIVNSDGTNLHPLAERTATVSNQYPSWSPTGRQLTWTRENRLWIADSSGKNAHALTNAPNAGIQGFFEWCASWSPDGKTIAFLRAANYEAPYEMWLINSDGKNERRLGTSRAYCIRWSKDPRVLYYSDGKAVQRLNVVDLSSTPCYRFEIVSDVVRWFSLSPDEKYIVYDTSGPDIDPDVMIDQFVYRGNQ